MERASDPNFIILNLEEKGTAVRALLGDDRTVLAAALELASPGREIEDKTIKHIGESVQKLVGDVDLGANRFMAEYRRNEIDY
jgi:hypothetical protein